LIRALQLCVLLLLLVAVVLLVVVGVEVGVVVGAKLALRGFRGVLIALMLLKGRKSRALGLKAILNR